MQRLGAYEIVRPLGEGGMAQVYLARDVRLGRDVAVKVLDQRLAERPGFRERFSREARLAASLDHPHIVPLYDFGETDRLLYLVMPYVSGGSLQDRLRKSPFPAGEVVTFGTQMADALDYAHRRHVVHRDVKPANMLVHADGRLMLSDFGLAKILLPTGRPVHARAHPDAGTPEYMAPEQIQGRSDERSDIYALGVVLYLLLTGRLPFSGPTSSAVMESHLYRLPPEPRTVNPAISPALQAVVLRALAKHADDRFQNASELGAALLGALVAGDAEPLPFMPGSAVPPPSLPGIVTPRPAMVRATRVFSTYSAHSAAGQGTFPGALGSRVTGVPRSTGAPWHSGPYPVAQLPPVATSAPVYPFAAQSGPRPMASSHHSPVAGPALSYPASDAGAQPASLPSQVERAREVEDPAMSFPLEGSFGQRFWLILVLALLLICLVAAVLFFSMRDPTGGVGFSADVAWHIMTTGRLA